MTRILSLLLLLAATNLTLANDQPSIENDVVYGMADGVELKLDLVTPAAEVANGRALLLIHGGGWQSGDKQDFLPFAREASQRGYLCATINYRHAPAFRFPAQVEDAKCAARWLRSNAQRLKIDPQLIGAAGASAGAHLAMMLGVLDPDDGLEGNGGHGAESSKVQAVVSLFGPSNFLSDYPPLTRSIVQTFIGGTAKDKADDYRRASPITYVSAGDAPMLLYQGTRDALVPHDQAVQMAEALTAAGVGGRVELLLGANHGWGGKELQRTVRESLEFFDERLSP